MSGLAVSFADSFPPERMYLSRLLLLVSEIKESLSLEQISEITGIPQGKSTGKVSTHFRYLKGMGLIMTEGTWYIMSEFGETVLANDRSFSESITQWLCHAFLCDKENGALLYSRVFSSIKPDKPIKRSYFDSLASSKPPITALLGTYTNQASFMNSRILVKTADDSYVFHAAPIDSAMINGYGAFICYLMRTYFASKSQVSVTEFSAVTGITSYFGWTESDLINVLNKLASAGYIKIEANLNPLVFSQMKSEPNCWKELYDNLI